MRFGETIEVKSNLILTARERGKIVGRREGHNIWLDLGREYLAQLISYMSYGPPPTTYREDRIQYMGLGIGGTRQLMPGVANSFPMTPAYDGTNLQTDTDPTVQRLERPVRIQGGSDSFPYPDPSNVWLGQVQSPTFPLSTQVVFSRLFQQTEVSYGPFNSVPVSEVMLYTSAADPTLYNNTGVAYDTFDSIPKTSAIDIEVAWTIRF
jgi:hypothetical protein